MSGFRAGCLALFWLAAAGAAAQERQWPSAPFRGTSPEAPPCTCRSPAGAVEVGREICLATPEGRRRARCVMVLNNTSWAIAAETCHETAGLARRRATR